MTVSIQKPYWRAINGVRELATALVARVTSRIVVADKRQSGTTKADEWSAVMAQSSTAPNVAMAPVARAPVATAPAVTPAVVTPVVAAPAVLMPPVAAPPVAAPAVTAPIAATTTAPPANAPARQRAVNSAWVLTVMVLVVCGAATGWLFAHGTAAAAWLIALVVVAFGGVPIGLVALRLFGYEDPD
jgi:hypothetical protein